MPLLTEKVTGWW